MTARIVHAAQVRIEQRVAEFGFGVESAVFSRDLTKPTSRGAGWSRTNPLRGAPRIHGELLKLGPVIAQRTVAKYMIPRVRRPPS